MVRRLAALLLIASSGWLLYQTTEHFVGLSQIGLADRLIGALGEMKFLLPSVGGLLGLLGGLIVFFGGVGGAAIAIIGGLVAAGFSIYVGQSFIPAAGQDVWRNEALVGLAILLLAGVAAIMGRD
jgi:hypothetical protein